MSKIINIMYTTGEFFGFAGSSDRYRRYMKRMKKHNLEPVVITTLPASRKTVMRKNLPLDEIAGKTGLIETSYEGIKSFLYLGKLATANMRWAYQYIATILFLRRFHKTIDIIHILIQPKILTLPLNYYSSLYKKPMVLSLTKQSNMYNHFLFSYLMRKECNLFDHIFVQNDVQMDNLKQLGVSSTIEVLPNGVDTDLFCPVDSEAKLKLRSNLGLPQDKIIFSYSGSLQPRKGTDILLEAWKMVVAKHDNVHLLLIGPRFSKGSWGKFDAVLNSTFADPHMSKTISHVGHVDNVNEYLQVSDFYIFPSKREGVPNAVLEAMACALPCILTPYRGLSKEMGVCDEHYILTKDFHINTIAESMINIIRMKEADAKNIGINARRNMIDTMSLDHAVEIHNKVYNSISK